MLRGLFVTGTDTGIGKTVVSAALMHRFRDRCQPDVGGMSDTCIPRLKYWKPIQTGIEQDDDTAEVAHLGECPDGEVFNKGIRLPRPLSPHLAARLDGQILKIDSVLDFVQGEPESTRWIVEGAGGVLVPINDSELMVDLMVRLALPVLIVSRSALGTINHTLLTIESLRARRLSIAGVVMVGPSNPENGQAVAAHSGVPIVGEMPMFDMLTPDVLRRWATAALDPDGRLLEHFR